MTNFQGRYRQSLDVIATLSMIAASVAMIWFVTQNRRAATASDPLTYEAGETFASVAEVDFKTAPRTLVLWVRSGCHFCTESMNFYKKLTTTSRRTRIIVMGLEPKAVLQEYLTKYDVKPDQVVSVPVEAVKLPATPILLLVGSDSKIQNVWRGKLNREQQENEVLDSLN